MKFAHLDPFKHRCHAGGMKKKTAAKPTVKPARAKRPAEPDVNLLAHQLGRLSTEPHAGHPSAGDPSKAEISRVMAALGRKGGIVGGRKRAEALTSDRKMEIALKAARARWDKAAKANSKV